MTSSQCFSEQEKNLLTSIDRQKLFEDTSVIASFDRRSGSEGEQKALDFISHRLSLAGIDFHVSNIDVGLSTPLSAQLKAFNEKGELIHSFLCKTWNFDAPSNGPVIGSARFIEPADLANNPLTWLANRSTLQTPDFNKSIIVSTAASPVAVMDTADRGAAAFVHVWSQGEELLVHEGNTSMIWGYQNQQRPLFIPQYQLFTFPFLKDRDFFI